MKKARTAGFDSTALRMVLRRRATSPARRLELDALVAGYEQSLLEAPAPEQRLLPAPREEAIRQRIAVAAGSRQGTGSGLAGTGGRVGAFVAQRGSYGVQRGTAAGTIA